MQFTSCLRYQVIVGLHGGADTYATATLPSYFTLLTIQSFGVIKNYVLHSIQTDFVLLPVAVTVRGRGGIRPRRHFPGGGILRGENIKF